VIPLGIVASRAVSAPAPGGDYLDLLAVTPVAAWSMNRKLVSSATVAIRVRRSSDNTQSDIGFSGDVLDAGALASFVGANDAFVTNVYDQTGNGRHLGQGDSAKQPRIVLAGVFDAAMVFDFSNDCLVSETLTMGTSRAWVFAEWECVDDASVRVIAEMSDNYSANNNHFAIYTQGSIGEMLGGFGISGARLTSFANASGIDYWTYLFDKAATGSDQVKAWRDGTAMTPTGVNTTDVGGTFANANMNVGSRSNGGGFPSSALIRQLVVYNADASAIRADIEAILAA
jgi:hypothetical protein